MRCSKIKSSSFLLLHWRKPMRVRQTGCCLAFACPLLECCMKAVSRAVEAVHHQGRQLMEAIFFNHLLHRSSTAQFCSLQKYLIGWLSIKSSRSASWTHVGCLEGQSLIWRPLFCSEWIHLFQLPSKPDEVFLPKKLGCSSYSELRPAAGLQNAQIILL